MRPERTVGPRHCLSQALSRPGRTQQSSTERQQTRHSCEPAPCRQVLIILVSPTPHWNKFAYSPNIQYLLYDRSCTKCWGFKDKMPPLPSMLVPEPMSLYLLGILQLQGRIKYTEKTKTGVKRKAYLLVHRNENVNGTSWFQHWLNLGIKWP